MMTSHVQSLLDARLAIRQSGYWAIAYLILAVTTLAWLAWDPRMLPSGDPVAMKPLKFAISFAVHCATLWLLGAWTRRAEAGDGLFALGVWLTVVSLIAEVAAIFIQAARGVPSHFNYETAFDRAMFTVMGLGTLGLLGAAVLILIGIVRTPSSASPLARLAVALGILLMLLGSAVGVLMVMPTPEQAALLTDGLRSTVIGSHAVGDGEGSTIPFLGWSLVSGDWRVAHFIGVHGFQAIPIVAYVLLLLPLDRRVIWQAFGALVVLYVAAFIWCVLRTAQGLSVFLLDGAGTAAVSAFAISLAAIAGILAVRMNARPGVSP